MPYEFQVLVSEYTRSIYVSDTARLRADPVAKNVQSPRSQPAIPKKLGSPNAPDQSALASHGTKTSAAAASHGKSADGGENDRKGRQTDRGSSRGGMLDRARADHDTRGGESNVPGVKPFTEQRLHDLVGVIAEQSSRSLADMDRTDHRASTTANAAQVDEKRLPPPVLPLPGMQTLNPSLNERSNPLPMASKGPPLPPLPPLDTDDPIRNRGIFSVLPRNPTLPPPPPLDKNAVALPPSQASETPKSATRPPPRPPPQPMSWMRTVPVDVKRKTPDETRKWYDHDADTHKRERSRSRSRDRTRDRDNARERSPSRSQSRDTRKRERSWRRSRDRTRDRDRDRDQKRSPSGSGERERALKRDGSRNSQPCDTLEDHSRLGRVRDRSRESDSDCTRNSSGGLQSRDSSSSHSRNGDSRADQSTHHWRAPRAHVPLTDAGVHFPADSAELGVHPPATHRHMHNHTNGKDPSTRRDVGPSGRIHNDSARQRSPEPSDTDLEVQFHCFVELFKLLPREREARKKARKEVASAGVGVGGHQGTHATEFFVDADADGGLLPVLPVLSICDLLLQLRPSILLKKVAKYLENVCNDKFEDVKYPFESTIST